MKFLQEIEQNSQEITRLLNVPTHTDITLTLAAFREVLDQEFAALTRTAPPIGAVIAWHRDLAGAEVSIPDNWALCSGGVVNDPESPMHGLTMPDLNGGKRFLRGNTASGGTGGSEQHSHFFNLSGDQELGNGASAIFATFAPDTMATEPGNSLPPYFDVVWIIRIK